MAECEVVPKGGVGENPEPQGECPFPKAEEGHGYSHFEFKCDGAAGWFGRPFLNGKPLPQVRKVEMCADVREVNQVTVTFVATPEHFDAEGRFIPLLELNEDQTVMGQGAYGRWVRIEEQAVRDLYEKLKARFEGEAS